MMKHAQAQAEARKLAEYDTRISSMRTRIQEFRTLKLEVNLSCIVMTFWSWVVFHEFPSAAEVGVWAEWTLHALALWFCV